MACLKKYRSNAWQCIAALLLVFFLGQAGFAQISEKDKADAVRLAQRAAGWRVYTPLDKSFRVQLPEGPISVLSSENGDMRNEMFDKGSMLYLFPKSPDEMSRFMILVVDLKAMGATGPITDNKWMDYMAAIVLGDYEEPQYLSQPRKISQKGLKGNEYKYIDDVGKYTLFSRGRLFNTGKELIALKYSAVDTNDLVSQDANRFLDSFEWTPKLRVKVPVPEPVSGMVGFRKTGADPLLVLNDANAPMISADGNRILVMPEIDLAEVYDVLSGKKLFSFGKGAKARQENPDETFGMAAISGDGRQVVIFVSHLQFLPNSHYTVDHTKIRAFDVDSGKVIDTRETGNCCAGMGQRFDGQRFIDESLTYIAGTHQIYSLPTSKDEKYGVLLSDLRAHTVVGKFGDPLEISDDWSLPVITPDALTIAATRDNRKDHDRDTTVVWNIKTQRELMKLPFDSSKLDLSANSRRLATHRESEIGTRVNEPKNVTDRFGLHKYVDTTPDYRTEIWDVDSGRRISEIGAEFGAEMPRVRHLALSPDGEYIVTTGDKYALVWDTNTGRLIAAQPNDGSLDKASFSKDGRSLVLTGGEVVKVYRFVNILKKAGIIRY